MLARRSGLTFINIFSTVDSFESFRAGAHVRAVDGTRVADGAGVARIGGAGVVQVAQQPRLPRRALTEEAADAVVARGAVETGGAGAVVDVLRTVGARPAVDADARVAAVRVGARGAVLAHAGTQGALVHVLVAVGTRERRRTLTRVAVDPVGARCSVLAQVTRAVVHVLFAVQTAET